MQGERHPFSPSRRDHRRRRRHPVIGHLRHQQIVGVLVLIIIVSTYLHTYASSAAVERITASVHHRHRQHPRQQRHLARACTASASTTRR